MNESLVWIEKAALENLRERSNNGDLIHKEANTLLTILLSGAGAALYFGMQHNDVRFSALAVSLWLFCIATILTLKCLMFGDYPSVWNEPKNLNQKGYDLDQLRQFELENIQVRISLATELNCTKSRRLNRCILAACSTPLVGFIAWLVSACPFFA